MPAANANILVDHYKKFFGNVDDVEVIFEIGANKFVDTKILHSNFKNANIYSFEPRISEPFTIGDKIKVYNKALSDVNIDSSPFFIIEGWEGASSLLKPKKEPGVKWTMEKEIREISVDVDTANNFCKKNNIEKIDVVWMDVQGNELRVLKGMTNFLADIKMIQTEAGVREYYENHKHEYGLKLIPGKHCKVGKNTNTYSNHKTSFSYDDSIFLGDSLVREEKKRSKTMTRSTIQTTSPPQITHSWPGFATSGSWCDTGSPKCRCLPTGRCREPTCRRRRRPGCVVCSSNHGTCARTSPQSHTCLTCCSCLCIQSQSCVAGSGKRASPSRRRQSQLGPARGRGSSAETSLQNMPLDSSGASSP